MPYAMGSGAIKGTVVSGLGEGKYFMSMPHYKNEIRKKLGFDPYPGTFNIKPENRHDLGKSRSISIDGFEKSGKKFGGASCYIASINRIKGAIIIPDINKHKGIIEFIAPEHLKSRLKLDDGDEVTIMF